MLDAILLLDEQRALLRRIVEAARRQPPDAREKFLMVATNGGDFIIHRELRDRVAAEDLETLIAEGLLDGRYTNKGTLSFFVSPRGFAYVDQVLSPAEDLPVPSSPQSRNERLEQVESLMNVLASRATGGDPSNADYREIREELLEDPDVGPLLPSFVRTNRNLQDFWAFMKLKFAKYDERRQYLREQFEPVLQALEARQAPTASSSLSSASTDTAPRMDDRLAHGDAETSQPQAGRRVFVVHGRDFGSREAVARFIERIGLEAVILEEQPNKGRTIIEKFEAYSDVSFAVVVLTPDDEGRAKGAGHLSGRARQNVILELGFFIGRLTRSRVAALLVGDVERPSDVQGVLYIEMDPGGGWKAQLAREFSEAGLPVDMSRL